MKSFSIYERISLLIIKSRDTSNGKIGHFLASLFADSISFPYDIPWLHHVTSFFFTIYILIWNRHGHECSRIWKLSGNFTLIQCIKKCRNILGRDISGDDFFWGQNIVSFNRTVVPYETSKVNFRVETKIIVSMCEES